MKIQCGNFLAAKAPAIVLSSLLVCAVGCHSYHVETTVENRTGTTVRLLEVDYPTASFGTENLASGADFHYRFQVRGSGPVKLELTLPGAQQPIEINGPTLAERQEGQLEIVLEPGGKAEFHPRLTPPTQ